MGRALDSVRNEPVLREIGSMPDEPLIIPFFAPIRRMPSPLARGLLALRKCKDCGNDVSTKAKSCPRCGAPIKQETSAATGCLSLIIIGVVIAACAGVFNDKKSPSSNSSPSKSAPIAPKVETREEKIEKLFSAWDGSLRSLEKVIKASMNDPDSYKHVETAYSDQGDHLVVKTTFRGKNAFGGVVTNWVKAKVGLDGNVIQVLDQGP
jgi:hypothetical protein